MESKDSKNEHIKRGRKPKIMSEEEKIKQYYLARDKNIERQRNYYEKNTSQEEICECGKPVVKKYLEKHKLTDLHKKRMEKLAQKQQEPL